MTIQLAVNPMIKSFKHKGLADFYKSGTTPGIQAKHATRLKLQLFALNNAISPQDMNAPNWKLHPLKGDRAEFWAITVNANWRIIFKFEDGNAYVVDYLDYH